MTVDVTRIRAEFWGETTGSEDGTTAFIEAVPEGEPGRVAIHTFVDDEGSVTSYYLDRESAITLARDLLDAVSFSPLREAN